MKKDKEGLNEELRDLSPFLRDLKPKGSGMQTPPGYFDQLEASIFDKIQKEGYQRSPVEETPAAGFKVWRRYRFVSLAAAVIVILLAAWWWMTPAATGESKPDYQQLAASLSADDAAAYILDNLQEFETGTLVEYASLASEAETNPGSTHPATAPQQSKKARKSQSILDQMSPEELELMLDDLSDEELEAIL